MPKYKAAIHMPSYNKVEQTIEAIQSVLNQTAQFPYVLYVQENSTDIDTAIMLNELSGSQVVVEAGDNDIGKSKQEFYENFDAEYLFQMDCDDLLMPEFLEIMVDFLESGMNAVYCGLVHIRKDGIKEVSNLDVSFPSTSYRLAGSIEPFQIGISAKAMREKMKKPYYTSYDPKSVVESLDVLYKFLDNVEMKMSVYPVRKILYIHRTTELSCYNKY